MAQTHQIKYIGPTIMLVLTLVILVLMKPKFVQTNGKVSIVKAVGISLVLALLLAVVLYFIPM
jgi:hypothetical protein